MATGIYTKVSGTWKEADDYFVNVNGVWKTGSEIHANVSGTWKQSVAAAPFVDTGNDVYIGPWSSSWTAPAGITQVRVTLVGGVSTDQWTSISGGFSGSLRFQYTGTVGAITSSSALAAFSAWESAHFSTVNSSSGQRYLTTAQRQGLVTSYTVNTGETVSVYMNGPLQYNAGNYPPSVGISGTLTSNTATYVGDNGAYGNKMVFQSVYLTGINYLVPARAGVTGATANMFGLSATGALTGNTPQTTGPTIVQVTPGTTYASSMGFVQTGYSYPFNQYVMGSVHIEW